MILFFSIQVSVSKSSLSLAVFCACSTSTPSQLLQNIFQSQLTLQLMHLQLLTLQSLSSYSPPPPPILIISSLTILYFSVFPTFLLFTRTSPGMVTSMILTSFLVLSIIEMSGRQASILVSHWIVKSRKIFFLNNSIWLILLPLWCSFKAMFFT